MNKTATLVIPAKAGIHPKTGARAARASLTRGWSPAFAGVTGSSKRHWVGARLAGRCAPPLTLTLPFVLLLFALGACSSLAPKLETPRLTIVRAAMTSADIFSQQFLVRLHVQNPNDRDLPVRGIDYQLFLEGDSFAEGVSSEPFVVPALGETEFDMVVRTNFVSGIGRLLSRLHGRDQVEYVFEGKVVTDIGMFNKIPFRESGTVSLAKVR